jgi:hypothetical protein
MYSFRDGTTGRQRNFGRRGHANVSPIVSLGTEQEGRTGSEKRGHANVTLAEPSSLEDGWRVRSGRLAEVTASVTSLVLDAVTTCVAN